MSIALDPNISRFDRIEAALIADSEESTPSLLEVEKLLPNLPIEKQEKLLELTLKWLTKQGGFLDEKIRFLSLYGDLFLAKEPLFPNLITSERCFATAFALGAENHNKLSRPLFLYALEGYRYQLIQAAGRGDVAKFRALLADSAIWHQKFSEHPEDIQLFYQTARSVYQGLNETNKKQFVPLLEEIDRGERESIPLENPTSIVGRYLAQLDMARESFQQEGDVRTIQKNQAEVFRNFFHDLIDDAIFILGAPPCRYEVRAMGSLAREEFSPYSDLEYFIVIENTRYCSYFQKLAQIVDLQILSLGETDPKHQEIFQFGQKFGLEIDHQANPAYHSSLIGTPDELFQASEATDADGLKAFNSRFTSVRIHGDPVFKFPRLERGNSRLLEMRKEEFQSLIPLQGKECDVKREFSAPLFYLLADLGRYLGFEETNTLDLIEKLPYFTPLSRRLLMESVSFLFRLRIRLHLAHGGIQDSAALEPQFSLPVLTKQEKEFLLTTLLLILSPLYAMDMEGENIDLIEMALQEPDEEKVFCVAQFLRGDPVETHLPYYRLLQSPDHLDLQETYLAYAPDEIADQLAPIPNLAGYRLSRKREEEELAQKIQAISTKDSRSGVKIATSLLDRGTFYLTQEAAHDLLTKDGDIKKTYPKSLHNVHGYGGLHFKQMPYQPLMEYAIYSLTHRMMGKTTPVSTLARIETPGKKVYPVLLSETLTGEELSSDSQLNVRHYTWALLCELLSKPGDGRAPNYIVQDGKVFCVDNDISFMEPVLRETFGNRVVFCSALFTLDQPLDQEVLKEFCELKPDLILRDWLDELLKRQELYLSLFPNESELKGFYEGDRKKAFTPLLLLPKGTIATLSMQFYALQAALREKQFSTPYSLLRELISLQGPGKTQVGLLVERQYQKALATPFPQRLQAVTSSRSDQSMTSERAMQVQYSKIPTFEEVQKQTTYSLQEGLEELKALEAKNLWNLVNISEHETTYRVEVDFGSIDDPEREKILLNALISLYHLREIKPSVLALRNTKTLYTTQLAPLLHKDLRSLDLSHGARIRDSLTVNRKLGRVSSLSLIEKLSPQLEELHLEGCLRIQNPHLKLLHLKHLNVNGCSNLQTLKATTQSLSTLKVSHCPRLTTLEVKLDPRAVVELEQTPNVESAELFHHLYLLGERYADGDGVTRDPARAIALWRRAAASNHEDAKAVIQAIEHAEAKGRKKVQVPGEMEDWGYNFLKVNETVTELDMRGTDLNAGKRALLSDKTGVRIGRLLKINQTLQSINLTARYEKEIQSIGAVAIAEGLKENSTLRKLSLSRNPIGDEGLVALANALRVNSSLLELNISSISNNGKTGLEALAEALKINTSLKELNVGCKVDIGAPLFADVLRENHTLEKLSILEITTAEGRGFLRDALQKNYTLTYLRLSSDGKNEDNTIETFLKRNQTFHSIKLGLLKDVITAFEKSERSITEEWFDFVDGEGNTLLHLAVSYEKLLMGNSRVTTLEHFRDRCLKEAREALPLLFHQMLIKMSDWTYLLKVNSEGKTAYDLAKENGALASISIFSGLMTMLSSTPEQLELASKDFFEFTERYGKLLETSSGKDQEKILDELLVEFQRWKKTYLGEDLLSHESEESHEDSKSVNWQAVYLSLMQTLQNQDAD